MTGTSSHIRYVATFLLALVLTSGLAVAQNKQTAQISPEQRQKVLQEMREFKHNAFVQKLDLTKEQQQEFFKLYDQMDDELMAVNQETRRLERRTQKDTDASDAELLATARAIYNQKKAEADIELKYFDKFSEVLTARQMVQLRAVERWITMQMATFAGRMKARPAK